MVGGTTSAEFLAIMPKKEEEDHVRDMTEMKKVSEKLREITLNPKMDLEEAIDRTKKLSKKIE